jgi:hypothetical protein
MLRGQGRSKLRIELTNTKIKLYTVAVLVIS